MAQPHDFERMAEIAKAEIERDAPKLKKGLDLTSGTTDVAEPEMVDIVRQNWMDPKFRHEMLEKETPEKVIRLLLKANDVRNFDGTPMTVHQYTKNVLEPFEATGTSPYLTPPPPAAPATSPTFDPTTPPLGIEPQHTAPILDPNSVLSTPAPSAPLVQPVPAPEAPALA